MLRSLTPFTIVFILATLIAILLLLPCLDLSELRKTTENQESLSATLRNIGILALGVLAIPLAVWRGWSADQQAKAAAAQVEAAQSQVEAAQRQVEATTRAMIHERYQKGIEALGGDSATTRMAGIYSLSALAVDHLEYGERVFDLLCAFTRNPPGLKRTGKNYSWNQIYHIRVRRPPKGRGLKRLSPFASEVDYLEALRYVTSKQPMDERFEEKTEIYVRDLKAVEFPDGPIAGVYVPGAELACIYACDSIWLNPICSATNLSFATLCNSRFVEGDFSNANFRMAYLTGAIFQGGSAVGAKFAGADLTNVKFIDCDLSGAHFSQDETVDDPAKGITIDSFVRARADPDNPPILDGVNGLDGREIVWRA